MNYLLEGRGVAVLGFERESENAGLLTAGGHDNGGRRRGAYGKKPQQGDADPAGLGRGGELHCCLLIAELIVGNNLGFGGSLIGDGGGVSWSGKAWGLGRQMDLYSYFMAVGSWDSQPSVTARSVLY